MRKFLTFILTACICLMAFTGCGGKKSEKITGDIELPVTKTVRQYGITETVVLRKKPERVATLSFTPVMALYKLGIKQIIVPENKMGRWPADLEKDARQMSTAMASNFDIEAIVAAQPDLVILPYHAKEKYGKILESQKIPAYYVDAGPAMSYQSVKETSEVLVEAFGKHSEAGRTILQEFSRLEKRMAETREKNKGKKVMVLMSAPPNHYIQNEQANLGSMMQLLGYENVFKEKNIKNSMVMLDKEKALSYQPDIVVSTGFGSAGQHETNMKKDFASNPEYWNQIAAIRSGRIIFLSQEYAVSRGINVVENINTLIDMLENKGL
ncbi:MAG: ABC transporter substrate-binding protein [Acidaminococcaceae bacterium]|nr:ABC transporter substrate-binding protein [Acidaminococcaceae bacterium]MBQ9698372.1 ABC transporter substrate-binding protein [Acidaminococcaceae bacterium]MBR1590361.1 ABC transporter substrate-binding protein [Acidaminococcaceae bacterium]